MLQRALALAFSAGVMAWLAAANLAAQAADGADPKAAPRAESTTVTVVQPNDIPVPRVLPACTPGPCPFAGQKVTVIATKSAISLALLLSLIHI